MIRRIFDAVMRPLKSRKVRVAMATVLAAYAAEIGWNVSEELVLTILGVGVALILGIAHEDHGRPAGTDVTKKSNLRNEATLGGTGQTG